MGLDVARYVMTVLVFIVAITIHEFAHAIVADRLGDPTPRSQGRISINPIDHIDPIGLIFMMIGQATGSGLGWGKPVMTRPNLFKHYRRDTMLVAVAGPLSNLLQALVFAAVIHINDAHQFYEDGSTADLLMQIGVSENIGLMLFNLIPVGPLDGAKVFAAFLPADMADQFEQFMARFGLVIFVLLIVTHATTYLIGPEQSSIFHFLADYR